MNNEKSLKLIMNAALEAASPKGKFKKTARHYSAGGMLVGPSHENGGIPVIVDGNEPIEVEGGEFIINKQTVDSVGEDFLHKLNSTDTTHHTGGFNEGTLPSPSQYKDGGKVTNGRSKMARGRATRKGTTPARRRMARGGKMSSAPKIVSRSIKQKFSAGGQIGVGKRVTRTKPVKFASGGSMGSTHYDTTNSSCRKSTSDISTCNNTKGCHYDYQRELCVGR